MASIDTHNVSTVPQIVSPSVVVKMTCCSLVGLLSLVGNVLVIVVVFRVARMKTTTFYLIVNLCVSDILFTLVAMPLFMQQLVSTKPVITGDSVGAFLCKFVNPSVFGLMASSVLTMTAIALDRYLAIKRPWKVMTGMKMLRGMIISIWAVSFLAVSMPLSVANKLEHEDEMYYCDERWTDSPTDNEAISRVYTVVLFIIIYMIPFSTMAVLYVVVAHHLWFRQAPSQISPIQLFLRISRRKVVRMLVAVWMCFIVCWLPLQVLSFVFFFNDSVNPSKDVLFTAEFLIRANGAINPFLYVIFSRAFRKATMKAFPICFKQ